MRNYKKKDYKDAWAKGKVYDTLYSYLEIEENDAHMHTSFWHAREGRDVVHGYAIFMKNDLMLYLLNVIQWEF